MYEKFYASESGCLKFLEELVNSFARETRREKFLHRHFQHFRDIEQRFVIDV
jgi:hypothetical protein